MWRALLVAMVLIMPADLEAQEEVRPNSYTSVGLFDHKTGLSLVSYAYNLVNNGDHEVFVGAGSALLATTASVGWKYYLFEYGVDFYSVLAAQGVVAGMAREFTVLPVTFASLGFEKKIGNRLWVNAGVNVTIRLYPPGSSHPPDVIPLPNLNINWRR